MKNALKLYDLLLQVDLNTKQLNLSTSTKELPGISAIFFKLPM